MDDHSKLIEAMKAFCAPEAQAKRLREKWAKATGVFALHYDMTHDPAQDGSFEIIFVTPEEAEKALNVGSSIAYITKISFAAGVTLARQSDCIGGSFELANAKIIAQVNLEARHQNELYCLGL